VATLVYGVRIRNVANTTDEWVFTSNPTDAAPYIAEPPTGDGQELDPLKGSVTVGQYRIKLVDWLTGPNTRAVTSILADVNARLQQLARLVFIETSTNGAPYVPLVAGYTSEVTMPDAMHFEFTIGNTRRIELNVKVFDIATPHFNGANCFIGGPIATGWGPVEDKGPVLFVVTRVSPAVVGIQWVAGPAPPTYQQINFNGLPQSRHGLPTRTLQYIFKQTRYYSQPTDTWIASDGIYASYSGNSGSIGNGVFAALYDFSSRALIGQFPMLAATGFGQPNWLGPFYDPLGNEAGNPGDYPIIDAAGGMNLNWPSTDAIPQPAAGTLFYCYMFPSIIDTDHPVHILMHPMDIIAALDLENGVMNDPASVAAVRQKIGPDTRLACRITKSSVMGDWKEQYVYIPFGVGGRVNAAGQMTYFTTRIMPNTPPTVTIGINDIRDDKTIAFDLDDQAACTTVTLSTLRFVPDSKVAGDQTAITPQIFNTTDGSSTIVGASPITDTLEAAILFASDVFEAGLGAPFQATQDTALDDFANAMASQIFGLFGQGANYCERNCLPSVTADVGDLVIVNLPDQPGASLTQSPIMQRGTPRVMMVIRRTETPAGPNLKLIDIGESAAQTLVPTFTLGPGHDTRYYALATLTNATALAAIPGCMVRVEVAFSASPPGNGSAAAYLNPATTTTWRTPRVDAGMPVSVRMRAEVPATLPGPWSAWQTITLVPLNPVTSPVVTLGPTGDIATLGFVPGEPDYPTVIALVEGTPGVPTPAGGTTPVAGLGTIVVTPNPVNLTLGAAGGEIVVTPNPVNLTLSGGSSGGVGSNPTGRIGFSAQSSDSGKVGYATGWSLMTPGGIMVPEVATQERYLVPSASSPTSLTFNFADLDALVNQALAASVAIKIYAFIGNNGSPSAAYGVVTSQAAAEDWINTWIAVMLAHYGDIFDTIVPVNEALVGGSYMPNPFYNNWTSPTDFTAGYLPYILNAFHTAFTSARLALNFGSMPTNSSQRAGVLTLATGIVGANPGVLGEISEEFHVNASDVESGALAAAMPAMTTANATIGGLGLKFGASEFDVRDDTGIGAGDAGIPSRDALNNQGVGIVAGWFVAQPNAADFVFWNPADPISWYNLTENPSLPVQLQRGDSSPPRPDLLDSSGNPKAAYTTARTYFPQLAALGSPPPVTPPGGAGGGGGGTTAHQPGGATVKIDSGAITSGVVSGSGFTLPGSVPSAWNFVSGAGSIGLSNAASSDALASGMRFYFPAGNNDDPAYDMYCAVNIGTNGYYLSYDIRLMPGLTVGIMGCPNLKLFAPKDLEGDDTIIMAAITTWPGQVAGQFANGIGMQGPGASFNIPNWNNAAVPAADIFAAGGWNTIEVLCETDSPAGAGNGSYTVWMNGIQAFTRTGIMITAASQTFGITNLHFYAARAEYGGASPQAFYLDVNNLHFAGF
jgi:GH35 family endo-1,4-beta-xylanase